MANNRERLFDQFPHVSKEEWKEKVIVDLKGADFDKKLVWRTPKASMFSRCMWLRTLKA